MKIVAIIQARMGSTRLPNKVLMPVLGKPLLGWMIDRVRMCSVIDEIVIATTTLGRDDQIVDFASSEKCTFFRGSSDDVLDRYYSAALATKADVIVRLTADCPLHDPKIISHMIELYILGGYDFLSNSEPLPSTWPDGMDVSIFSITALKNAWENAIKPSEREHVTFHFWNNPDKFNCKRVNNVDDLSRYRLTIDYPEDFILISKVIKHFESLNPSCFGKVTMVDIVHFLEINPEIFNINSRYSHGLGWETAFDRDRTLGF